MTVLFVVFNPGTSANDDTAKNMRAQNNTSASIDALGVVNICILSLLAEVFNFVPVNALSEFFHKRPQI